MPLLPGKIYSPSVFFAGLRIDQFELLYVNRRIGTERKRLPILIFQLFQKVRIIIFQAGKNRGIHDDTNLEPFFTLFPLQNLFESALNFHAHADCGLDAPGTVAVGTAVIDYILNALMFALTGHFHQPEFTQRQNLGLGTVVFDQFLHIAEKFLSGNRITAPCYIDPSAIVENCELGPYVSVAEGAVLKNCRLQDAIVSAHTQLNAKEAKHLILDKYSN